MLSSKPKKDESRRSSILKQHKPRQPLQNVNFNSSSNENSPATSKVKRRVSFAEKKHVKEFCHSTEQGTVWDNTYEEHDTKVDSKESASKIGFEDDNIDIDFEINSSLTRSPNLTESQPCTSIEVYEDDNNLNFTNPVEILPIHVEIFSQELPFGQIILPNTPEDTPDVVPVCTDRDKENHTSSIHSEYYPEMHTREVNSELDRTCIQDVSMEFTTVIPASLIPVYHDVEDDKQEDIQKGNVVSHQDNFDTNCTMEITKAVSWRNKVETYVPILRQQENIHERKDTNSSFASTERTKLLLKSMDITEAVSVPLCQERMYNIEHIPESLNSNCNNDSIEITQAVPVSVEPIKSSTEAFRKVPVIVQNCEDARHDVPNNSMVIPTLQSTKSIVPRIDDTHCSSSHLVPDNSMKLTSMVQSLATDSDRFNMNDDRNDAAFNISMEMTTALPCKIYEENTTYSCNRGAIKKDDLKKSWKNTEHTDKTEFFNDVPMEMTRLVNLYERNIPRFNSEDTRENLRKNRETNEKSNKTEFFDDAAMQMTQPINTMLPSVYNKNLRINEPIFRDDRNTSSYNMSVEMTEAVLSRNREEMLNPIIHEKSKCGRNMNNSMTSNETRTKLLCKSMEITEVVPGSLPCEETCNIENTPELLEAMVSHTATTPETRLPAENATESPLRTVTAANNETINSLMEITAAIQSTVHHTENILNRMENLNVSKSNESRRSTVNDAEFRENEMRKNVTISKETVETTTLYNTSSNTHVLTNNLDHSLSTTLTNDNGKRSTHECANVSTKKFRSDSPVESSSVYSNMHSSARVNDKYVSNERSIEDMNLTRMSEHPCGSNSSDSLNKIDECSFLRKNLENSLVELQSINPPSFVSSSIDENSCLEVLRKDKLRTSIITDAVTINNENSHERLESTNIEHDETEDCHRSVVADTVQNNRGTDCQGIERTIIDDYRVDETSRHETDVEHLDGESALSTSNVSRRKTMTLSSTDRFIETNVTRENQVEQDEHCQENSNDKMKLQGVEQKEDRVEGRLDAEQSVNRIEEEEEPLLEVDEEEYIQEKVVNDEVELRDIEQEEQCSEAEKEEEHCIDHLKEAEVTVKDQVDQDEHCQKNSNSKVKQDVEQKEDRTEERLDAEQSVNRIEEEEPLEQDPFLSQKLETFAESEDCIWNVYYKNVDRRMIGFGFMSDSLLIVTFLSDSLNHSEENLFIKGVRIISRLADDVDVLIKIVHGLILEKINEEALTHSYRTHEDLLPMLDSVSQEVKLAMNFMFDLKRLDDLNLMEIARDKISFVCRSKHMDIILKIAINVKRFDKLTPSDVNIHSVLGTIRETEVKNLIKNVKKDHKFLRRYMNDVKDYIDIMEEAAVDRIY